MLDIVGGAVVKYLTEDAKFSERRPDVLRASSLPLCPVSVVLSHVVMVPVNKVSWVGEFFTEVGTTVHTTTQRWLARGQWLWGHWNCPNCGLFDQELSCDPTCPQCGAERVYEELSLRGPGGLSAHCDGVLRCHPVDVNRTALLEIKTTSLAKRNGNLPYSYHKAQTSAYCTLLHRNYGIQVEGVVFLYIPRDLPHLVKPVIYTDIDWGILEREAATYDLAKSAIDTGDFSQLKPLCSSPSNDPAEYCPWKTVCFLNLEDNLRRYWQMYRDQQRS